jgi:hypothetical protein
MRGGLLSRASRRNILEKAIIAVSPGVSHGIVFEYTRNADETSGSRISSMVSGFGTVEPLTPGRCLILFNPAQDGDLIALHLAKNVPGKSVLCFRAKNPQEALTRLNPYF